MIKGVYTTHPGAPILRDVARILAQETERNMDEVRQSLILLPTRRAIRILEEKMPEAFALPTVLLPKLMAVGDIELPPEEEDEGKPPPRAINGIERLYSLLPFIEAEGLAKNGFDANWRLAQEIVKLVDLLQTEELGPEALDQIGHAQSAQQWQDSAGLFQRVAQNWLDHLKRINRVNSAAARNLRIDRLIERWHKNPPQHPVWLVGSTGSVVAVRRLMNEVLQLPRGAVLLPGLDKIMDDASWAALPEAHPQAILKRTINALSRDRREIDFWPTDQKNDDVEKRAVWLSQALSPLPSRSIAPAAENVTVINSATPQEEVEVVAHFCAHVLQDSQRQSIVVVSNDSTFAQRLSGILGFYGIGVDSSAGYPLSDLAFGGALSAFIRFLSPASTPQDVWAALKHPLFAPIWPWTARQNRMAEAETVLRDSLSCPNTAEEVLALLDPAFANAANAVRKEAMTPRSLPEWAAFLRKHCPAFVKASSIVDKLAAEAVERAFDDLAAAKLPRVLTIKEASPILCDTLLRIVCRPPALSPSVHVLGTLEARLIEADIAVLTGLNEGHWPDAPQPSPFLSRGMRHSVGLPDSERHAALSGHDFQQAFLSKKTVISRATRDKDGPTLPARWCLRLKAVTPADIWQEMEDRGNALIAQRHRLHKPEIVTPAPPPSPRADQNDLRLPLSVTSIETWRADPYSFWAKHVLNLRRLEPIFPIVSAAARGTIWHAFFKRFVETFDPDENDAASEARYDAAVEVSLKEHALPQHRMRLWRARLHGLRTNLIRDERLRRSEALPVSLEERHVGDVGGLPLQARVDRIDQNTQNLLTLCDYKTGEAPKKKSIERGYSCQLSLLALMLRRNVESLEYIELKGGRTPPNAVSLAWTDEFAEETEKGFTAWVKLFLEQGHPFLSLADHGGDRLKKAQDYLHLARHQEWGRNA